MSAKEYYGLTELLSSN